MSAALPSSQLTLFYQSASIASQSAETAGYGFIALLGLAQRLGVDFLPLTWQAVLGSLEEDGKGGRGGQAKIFQSYVNPETSFAFKRFERDSFREVVSELLALAQDGIRKHPYITNLEGLCWDVMADDDVQPVLVFEKSHFGDLYHFMRSGEGKDISMGERMRLCVDIGIAIRDMHANNIIHGDVKPRNILVFQESPSKYVAKVADFGFSTQFIREDDLIRMPKSGIWCAPEWHHRGFRPEAARKMDIFSFGLVCVWMLFGDNLTKSSRDDGRVVSFEEDCNPAQNLLERWKVDHGKDELTAWALSLVRMRAELSGSDLATFFKSTLAIDPHKREINLSRQLHHLDPARTLPEMNCLVAELAPAEEDFRLYSTDFRIPSVIVRRLEHISSQPAEIFLRVSPRKAALQLELAYAIGFGVTQDSCYPLKALSQHSIKSTEIESQIKDIREQDDIVFRNSLYWKLNQRRLAFGVDFAQYYRERQLLDRAEMTYRRDIKATEILFGSHHPIHLAKKVDLSNICTILGRWKEAEELELQVMETRQKILGEEHPNTLASKSNLALTYRNQGRWRKAEQIEAQLMETAKRVLGEEHPQTLTIMGNLAATYRNQGLWMKAEELQVQVMEIRTKLLGDEHPDTLTTMSDLALTYWNQGRWTKAEELQVYVIKISKRVLGDEHPDTLISLGNLALTYWKQERWPEAEELFGYVMETSKSKLGVDHPYTLVSMANLAATYRDQGRWKNAEGLEVQAMETAKRVFGEEHPHTLTIMANLALTYRNQGQWTKAEEMQVHVIETRKRVLRDGHPDTLTTTGDLAKTYQNQGQWMKAEGLQVQLVDAMRRLLGKEHPKTLIIMADLACTWKARGWHVDALSLMGECVQGRSRVLGPDHPDTVLSSAVWMKWQTEAVSASVREGNMNED
ncbi:mutator-like element [Purpureocillium lavendulum]|uniref:Mutator-like element n=1 Tax=Purpureocillium lavendulum TaxID=1247861 RepID=A0AB34FHZ4_9HYPO|nr:mutator-like element [Purpureocillium lavendulum]